ncbi:hypothetical protein MRX96_041168 [Rhipicephalus microplus]
MKLRSPGQGGFRKGELAKVVDPSTCRLLRRSYPQEDAHHVLSVTLQCALCDVNGHAPREYTCGALFPRDVAGGKKRDGVPQLAWSLSQEAAGQLVRETTALRIGPAEKANQFHEQASLFAPPLFAAASFRSERAPRNTTIGGPNDTRNGDTHSGQRNKRGRCATWLHKRGQSSEGQRGGPKTRQMGHEARHSHPTIGAAGGKQGRLLAPPSNRSARDGCCAALGAMVSRQTALDAVVSLVVAWRDVKASPLS